jgi:hypothetical protein
MNSINIQGNILNYDILERIAQDQEGQQAPKDYGFQTKPDILSALESSWGIIKSQFNTFQIKLESLKEGQTGVTETRKYWMDPFLSELGYEIRRNESGQVINDRNYFVSHRAENRGAFPIHIIGVNQSLDKKYPGMRMSSHALIQEYLNHHDNLYAFVTNGKQIRLLRDSQLLTKISFIEFDLEKMMTEDQFSDFVLLWKLLHITRMPEEPEKGTESIIELYHVNSLESGSRIREKLSLAVKEGILKLGNGLLQEQENETLREWLNEKDNINEYYGELLRLIYRLLFIMVIEERDLIYPKELDTKNQKKKFHYYNYYSLKRLRNLARMHHYANEQHYDLWAYLLNVFTLYETPIGQKLGIQPLAGDLFSTQAMPHLFRCQLNNQVLLEVFSGLSFFENEQGQYMPVNYKSLDVEEFGSVYEGLLELDPAIDITARRFSFVQGDDRSISGSHYTPDELVQPLIKHSLEHLIQDILKENIEDEDKIKKLLKLTVCDVACGSGHILLAAARRIGLAVARLRSGEEQPNPTDTRKGIRDAIKHCIYGVDRNPLAVELCKVAMWLEAHVPGEPLNFLDHKIKNGDAIVGLAHLDELYNGIATEAFKAYRDEEKENCRLLKASNKKQRQAREAGQLRTHNVKEIVENKLAKFKERFEIFQTLPENTVEEIEAKKKAYKKLNIGTNWWAVKTLADLQIAQFFVDKSNIANVVTDDDYFDIMAGRIAQTKAEVMAIAEAEPRKFFHWFLEFPEVFGQGGFDCILGNPPFLGNRKLSGFFGQAYKTHLTEYFTNAGTIDLVGYFYRRVFSILKINGFQSLIAACAVTQLGTREGSLDEIVNLGGQITHANRCRKWPGEATTEIVIITIKKGLWDKIKILDGKEVGKITTFLDDQITNGIPKVLQKNTNIAKQGTIVLGDGLIISKKSSLPFLKEDLSHIVKPYLTGDDIVSSPDQAFSRYVIDFGDLSLSEIKQYSVLYQLVESAQLNSRSKVIDKRREQGRELTKDDRWQIENWWKFWRPRKDLYDNVNKLSKVLLINRHPKFLVFSWQSTNIVFSDATVVFLSDKNYDFVVLSSCFHTNFAWKYSGRIGTSTLRYSPSQVALKFPLPQVDYSFLSEIGVEFNEFRDNLQFDLNLGLTGLYNQFHNKDLVLDVGKDITDPKSAAIKKDFSKESWNLYNHLQKTEGTIPFTEAVEKIQELRRLHKEMDKAVLEAYGWHQSCKRWGPAIELRHDFYEVDYLPENDRVRYTIHPDARKEVLKRLLLLNHEIHESEKRGIPYEELDREKIIELYREEIGSWLKHPEVPHAKTIKYLAYGEDLLPDLERKDIKEYSPYVAEICKAIENEILQKLFIPFNVQFQEEWMDQEAVKLATFIDEVGKDNRMRKFSKSLKNNNVKYTLGDMHFILNLVFSKSLKDNHLLKEFKGFVFSNYKDSFINKDKMKELDQLTLLYRNASAHADEKYAGDLYDIDKVKALECRDAVRKMMNLMVESEVNGT